ncbi:MAG: Nif3-like dinuclear metal center hexameric protein [Paludibacteraceae bacterium]|nr:Nif3-like dinuclear metal center hexameric protein [Paludibacteraceae bacterium]
MQVNEVTKWIEDFAPLQLQESYDNAGLLVGEPYTLVTGVLITIDVTEEVVNEAIENKCNLIIAHHPLIFKGLKRITGSNEVERCILKCIRHHIAVYAAHTNIDNVANGVSGRMADLLGLQNKKVLQPKSDILMKFVTFVPKLHSYAVRQAIFEAGAGYIGNYDNCSFNIEGNGTFRAGVVANPFVGTSGKLHTEAETRIEVILPKYLKNKVLAALFKAHPYEEPAYDFIPLQNQWNEAGAGIVGELEDEMDAQTFLLKLKNIFGLHTLRHTTIDHKKIKKVALCGGSGSSLLSDAITVGADVYISGDFKYHEFFDAVNSILIADIGHFESEQFTKDIFYEIITKKMPKFAVRISEIKTNPINYL